MMTKPYIRWDEPLRLELEHFMRVVRDDLDPVPSGKDAIEAIRVCDSALRSGKTRAACKN
jgi:predicted dehydrogenase